MIRVIICGANGAMGQVLADVISKSEYFTTVAGIDVFPDAKKNDFPVYPSAAECLVQADVIIDFSRPAALAGNLEYAKEKNLPIVIATTGYSEEDKAMIREYANHIPVFFTANMSPGVNLQLELCRQTAQFYGHSADIEIIEKHHNLKADAPSGTALAIADVISQSFVDPMEYQYGRHGLSAKRKPNEIGIHAVRGGRIVGEHQVLFITNEEVVEITHTSQSKEVFATGALRGARFLLQQQPALYSMQDIVFETRTVTSLRVDPNEAMIRLENVPHSTSFIANLFDCIASAGVNVDIISQTAPKDGKVDVCFSLPESKLEDAMQALRNFDHPLSLTPLRNLAKLTVEGIGMRSKHGVAAKLFQVLAEENIDILIITTSDIKISFCVDADKLERASQAIREKFDLQIIL